MMVRDSPQAGSAKVRVFSAPLRPFSNSMRVQAYSDDGWHFRLKTRGGALKGAHLLATCFAWFPASFAGIFRMFITQDSG